MPRYAVKRLEQIPRVPSDPGEPYWYPLQHHFGLTAFGANVYVASAAGEQILGDHDELGSDQEELYFVTAGEATFILDGETVGAPAGTVVAVPDPAVRRVAWAAAAGATIVAVGGRRQASFETSWQKRHFEGVPRLS